MYLLILASLDVAQIELETGISHGHAQPHTATNIMPLSVMRHNIGKHEGIWKNSGIKYMRLAIERANYLTPVATITYVCTGGEKEKEKKKKKRKRKIIAE